MLRPDHLYGEYVEGHFLPPPFDATVWPSFLASMGVDVEGLRTVEPALGGLVNANYRLTLADGSEWFLRWYRQRDLPAVSSELELVAGLSAEGFPTPAPVQSSDGHFAREVLGWPAALFPYVAGLRPEPGPHCSRLRDLPLAGDVAVAAARLSVLTRGVAMSGTRIGAPLTVVDRYVKQVESDADLSGLPGMRALLDRLGAAGDGFRDIGEEDIPTGVIHGDLHEENILVDVDERLLWVLDFDDARSAALIFELVALFPYWARAAVDELDPGALSRLVRSYGAIRPLTDAEAARLGDAALLHQAAEVCSHFGHRERGLRAGTETLDDSYSLALSEVWGPQLPGERRSMVQPWLAGDGVFRRPLDSRARRSLRRGWRCAVNGPCGRASH